MSTQVLFNKSFGSRRLLFYKVHYGMRLHTSYIYCYYKKPKNGCSVTFCTKVNLPA
jgi:hypothetical protein